MADPFQGEPCAHSVLVNVPVWPASGTRELPPFGPVQVNRTVVRSANVSVAVFSAVFVYPPYGIAIVIKNKNAGLHAGSICANDGSIYIQSKRGMRLEDAPAKRRCT